EPLPDAIVSVSAALHSVTDDFLDEDFPDIVEFAVVGATIHGDAATLCWLGDAEAALYRGADIVTWTVPHTVAAARRAAGHTVPAAVKGGVLRVADGKERPESAASWPLVPGDRLLLVGGGPRLPERLGEDPLREALADTTWGSALLYEHSG